MIPLYQFEQVQFAYEKKIILNIKQLEIKANNITALVGKNGAGKSTLLKLLAFIESPQHGKIHFNSQKVATRSLLSLRRQIVLVAQKPYFLKGSVFENVLLGLKFRAISTKIATKYALKSLNQVGISSFKDRPVAELSGGEAQKVALARALALQPKVLLLDEPFSHLDQDSMRSLTSLISDVSQSHGASVIFSSHDPLHATTLAFESIHLVSGHCIEIEPHK